MHSLLQDLAGIGPVRRMTDRLFHELSRRRVRRLDKRNPARDQQAILLDLVRRARSTRFGLDHGMGNIGSVADYQARVPLRTYEAFWSEYWQPAFPCLTHVTWPGRIPYVALSSGTTGGTTKFIPISFEMLTSNREAALTTLAFFLVARPAAELFTGRFFFLGGSTDLTELGGGVRAGDLSGIAAREVSPLLRPYVFPPLDLALARDWDEKVERLARASAGLPIRVLSGVPSWLLVLFDRLKKVTGKEHIIDIWPDLQLVIHGGTKFDPYRSLFQREIGSSAVSFAETYPCSEGFVATEDPRHGRLRLLSHHGIFFEFVPVEELERERPTRHTVANLELGAQYAVVLTTCAGLWSYLVGDTVCFEKRDPPLLRFTGRTRYCLSAFGEHLISEEVEKAVAEAAEATDGAVVDFHVGPLLPLQTTGPGRHLYLIEFASPPRDLGAFITELDLALARLNDDYQAHRQGDLNMAAPEVRLVRRGGFAAWLRWQGRMGGQHKVPRMDSTGELTAALCGWLEEHQELAATMDSGTPGP
jgi:hypothetical protein